jgi:hypothetical protein
VWSSVKNEAGLDVPSPGDETLDSLGPDGLTRIFAGGTGKKSPKITLDNGHRKAAK